MSLNLYILNFQNDDYYSMVRGNKLISDTTCKHIVMGVNGSINFLSGQKVETSQVYYYHIFK